MVLVKRATAACPAGLVNPAIKETLDLLAGSGHLAKLARLACPVKRVSVVSTAEMVVTVLMVLLAFPD